MVSLDKRSFEQIEGEVNLGGKLGSHAPRPHLLSACLQSLEELDVVVEELVHVYPVSG